MYPKLVLNRPSAVSHMLHRSFPGAADNRMHGNIASFRPLFLHFFRHIPKLSAMQAEAGHPKRTGAANCIKIRPVAM